MISLFPDMKIFLALDIGSFHLQVTWYAVLILSGALGAYFISLRAAQKKGYKKELLENFFLSMLPISIIGARIYYVVFEWANFSYEPIRIFYIWEGGLAIHGGLIAAIVYAFVYFRYHGVNVLRIGDCIMPNVLLAQVIGRWGNFVNQEAYGEIVGNHYFDMFPSFIKDHMFIDGFYRMPMFLYEGIGNLIGFIVIKTWFKKYGYKKRGDMIYAYIAWYGVVRFFVEMFRTDALMWGGIRVAQLISLLFVLVGVLGLVGVYNRVFARLYPFKKERPIVLFDADGTLLDSEGLIQDSFRHTFAKFKPEYVLEEAQLRSFLGPSLRDTFAQHMRAEQVDEAVEYYREYNHAHHDARVKAMPHAKEICIYLKKHEYIVGVVSNKMTPLVQRGLECAGIDSYIDVVVGRDMVEHSKPDPEGLVKACTLLNYPVDDIVYIGDAPGDIEAAHRVDAYSVGYAVDKVKENGLQQENPMCIIHDFLQLKKIVEEDYHATK